MRQGKYGYDAPYALVSFGFLAVFSGLGAAIAWLRTLAQAAPITLCFLSLACYPTYRLFTARGSELVHRAATLDRVPYQAAAGSASGAKRPHMAPGFR